MDFCPDCGAMLLPKEGKLQCKCGYVKETSQEDKEKYNVNELDNNFVGFLSYDNNLPLSMRDVPFATRSALWLVLLTQKRRSK